VILEKLLCLRAQCLRTDKLLLAPDLDSESNLGVLEILALKLDGAAQCFCQLLSSVKTDSNSSFEVILLRIIAKRLEEAI